MSNNLKVTPTVFVVQDPDGKEITIAQKYGKLHVILTGHEPVDVAIAKLSKALRLFKTGDYLLPIGKSINMGIAIHLTLVYCPGPLNVLVWRREQYDYSVEKVNICL